MHDVPYVQSKYFGPEITATMSRICTEIRRIVPKTIPCGIQVSIKSILFLGLHYFGVFLIRITYFYIRSYHVEIKKP